MTERSYGMYVAYFTLAALVFNVLLAVYLGFGFVSALVGFLIAALPSFSQGIQKLNFPGLFTFSYAWQSWSTFQAISRVGISTSPTGTLLPTPYQDRFSRYSGSLPSSFWIRSVNITWMLHLWQVLPSCLEWQENISGRSMIPSWHLPWRLPCRKDAGR